jgi:hypothetical protein
MDFYKGSIPIIDDTPECRDYAMPGKIDGNPVGYGYVPRNYAIDPPEMFDQPTSMTLIPESDWDARYDEQEAKQSSLEHLYLSGPNGTPAFLNLDQNGHGYCWAYSTGHALMMLRLQANMPLVRLNPHATAAIIKGGRDEGGWCGLSAKWAREHGYAEEGTGLGQWPLHSRDLRYDTPALRDNMAKRKVTEEWVDLTKQVYDQNLTRSQVATCGFINTPVPSDFMWWSHSVCQLRWVRIERGSWGPLILNSWKGWGRYGLAVLRGTKAVCDGAVALRVIGIS